ncbi:MAG: pitrilysin family protein [Chthonomonadales bacterium]
MQLTPRLIVRATKFVALLCVSFFVGSLPAHAQRGNQSLLVETGTQLSVLPNGLRLIVKEQHVTHLVTVDVWVKAGAGKELRRELGAAHYMEHMLFKGTAKRKPGEIDAAIEDLGATLSAGTNYDAAHFYTTVDTKFTSQALEVLSDALQNSVLDQTEMDHERSVILDEIVRAQNDFRKQARNQLFEQLFPDQPFGRPVLGSSDSIRNLTRDTLQKFYEKWYAPNNTTIVVVGDINLKEADRLVRDQFSTWAKRDLPAATATEPTSATLLPQPAPQPSDARLIGFPLGIREDITAAAAAKCLAMLLGGARYGKIADGVKSVFTQPEEDPLPKKTLTGKPVILQASLDLVEVDVDFMTNGGAFSILTVAPATSMNAVQQGVVSALRKLQKTPVTSQELEAVKRQAIGKLLFASETGGGQAYSLGEWDARGDFSRSEKLLDAITKLKPKDVLTLADRLFEPARTVVTDFVGRVAR